MSMKLFVFILTFSFSFNVWALEAPRFVKNRSQSVLALGADARKALQKYNSNFAVVSSNYFNPGILEEYYDRTNEGPAAIVSDFNGDQIDDVVVQVFTKRGREHKLEVLLVYSDKPNGRYKVVKVKGFQIPNPAFKVRSGIIYGNNWSFYLTLFKASDAKVETVVKKIPKGSTGFKLQNWYSTTEVYYLSKGQIKQVN